MPEHFILLVSESFRKKTKKTALRKKVLAECLTDDFNFPKQGGSDQTIKMMREKGYDGKMRRETAYYERNILINAHRYYWGTEKQGEEIDSRRHKQGNAEYLGVNCLLNDGFQTRESIEAKMRELTPPLPEPEAPTKIKDELTLSGAEEVHRGGPLPASVRPRPFRVLADTIQDLTETGEYLYDTVEELRETITYLIKSLAKTAEENASFRRQLGDCERRLTEIEDLLTADPAQLTAIQTAAKRLKQDVGEILPRCTETGGYWKEILSTVYRKRFKKSLQDKGLQIKERDAIVWTIGQIMVDPFYAGLETEIRRNGDNGDASMIAGIGRGCQYYRSRVGVHRRLIWFVEGGDIHFVETETKETYTYA